MQHNLASDQGLLCLLTESSIKNKKQQNRPDTPKMTNGLVLHISLKECTNIQSVKVSEYLGKIRQDAKSGIKSH